MSRPSLVDIIAQYGIELRQAGRELTGLCPFHSEKTPSFYINEDRQVFYCHGCGAGGDVIRFVELIEGIDFKEAVKRLKLDYKPRPRPHKGEAETIATWARGISILAREALRKLSDQIRVCSLARKEESTDKQFIIEHEAGLIRAWAILNDFDDDLNDSKAALELYAQRNDIERLIELA